MWIGSGHQLVAHARLLAPAVPLDLGGSDWTVSNGNGSVTAAASVPGVVHADLMAAGIVPDMYYRFNDVEYRWVSLEDWTFSKEFVVPADLAEPSYSVQLRADGIQGVASVFLNSQLVRSSDNMFHRHVANVSGVVVAGRNIVAVRIRSSVRYAEERRLSYPYDVPLNPEYVAYQGFDHRNYMRSSHQSSFGWDWGIGAVSAGMYLPIGLLFFQQQPVIRSVLLRTFSVGALGRFLLHADVTLDLPRSMAASEVTMKASCMSFSNVTAVDIPPAANSLVVPLWLDLESVKPEDLWFPRGLGPQTLHVFSVCVAGGTCFDSRTGLRSVLLDTSAVATGSKFQFVVNGLPLFLRGANYVPADAFLSPSRYNATMLQSLLEMAAAANMNAIRVWGGGIFELDAFYDRADELGIMIWEEFKFACALVPRDPEFVASVSKEIADQVTRLSRHPSIIVYGGNNENEMTLGWTVDAQANPRLYSSDYDYFYGAVMSPLIMRLDPSRPFWPSSPSNGPLVFDQDFVVFSYGDPNNASHGDVHFYTYASDCLDPDIFPRPRFASEFGFQSYPSVNSLLEVALPSDLFMFSPLMEHRQHHPLGNEQLVATLSLLFQFDTLTTPFSSFVWLSQLMQGLCMQTEAEHYRRLWGTDVGTAGALYWQLNNVWQAPSWSSMEYGGSWKLAHYFSRRFYAPQLVSSQLSSYGLQNVTERNFEIWLVNDQPHALAGSTVFLDMCSFAGDCRPSIPFVNVTVGPLTSRLVQSLWLVKLMEESRCLLPTSCFALLHWVSSAGELLSSNYHLFSRPKDLVLAGSLRYLNLTVDVSNCTRETAAAPSSCLVRISNPPSSGSAALFVCASAVALGSWSDNVLPVLRPAETWTVSFLPTSGTVVDAQTLLAGLRVTSLMDHQRRL